MTANEVHHFPCSSCGADLVFEPGDGFLTCPYCGHKEAIPQSAEQVEEQSFELHLQIRPEQMAKLAANALEVQCQSCGAKTIFTPPEVAGRCEFCGVQIVAQPKSADPILTPGGLLPFRITQQQASSELRNWISSRWFAPNDLKRFAQPEAIHGVYLPFWTYDTNTTTQYTGQRGEYYYVTETYYETDAKGNQVQRTRQVRHTHWYDASGTVTAWFNDVLIPATLSLPPDRLAALAPWDLQELRPYEPAFLSGFKAQRYQVDLRAASNMQSRLLRLRSRATSVTTSAGTCKASVASLRIIPTSASSTSCYRFTPAPIATTTSSFKFWSTAAQARSKVSARTVFGRSRCW